METNNFNNSNDNQFMISYELICLLQWIIEHESESFKKVISKALESGFRQAMKRQDADDAPELDDIQEVIIDFFELCETLIEEVHHEQSVKKAIAKNLMPAIDHIDSRLCDGDTVRSSVSSTTAHLDDAPQESAKEILYRELLRQWKPNKKSTLN